MKKIYFIWGLVVVLLLSVVLIFGMNFNRNYKNLEKNMENVISRYLGEHLGEYPKSGSVKFEITDVIKKDYNLTLEVDGDLCEGYVVVSSDSIGYKYDAYIKCNNYVTKGYKNF